MSRFDEFMKKHGMDSNTIQPGDEQTMANNPRNALADMVNPLLDKSVNKILPQDYALNIPKQTVAEDKEFTQNLPENMAMGAMGSIRALPTTSGQFGKVIQALGNESKGLGKVTLQPSAADMAADALKVSSPKQLKGQEISSRFKELFGDATDKTIDSVARTQKAKHVESPGAYDSWKQEMLGKIARGEL